MSTVLLQKSTKAVAWIIAASLSLAFIAPTAFAFENLGTFKYQWVSQSGTLSGDGMAHEVAANPGDTVNMSMTIRNRSTNAAALTMYGTSALLDEGIAYPNAHAVGLGTSHPRDNVPAWIDSSSFAINGNRFTYYDGDAVNPGEDLTLTWTVKISSTAVNGTYDLYTEIVREFDGWAQQVTAGGVAIGNGDIFWRFLIGGTVTGGGDLNVGIAGDTPGDANIAKLSADVPMARISFTAGAADNALITTIAVRKTGLSADTDISDLKLYDGATKLGSTQAVNSTSHKATFTGLSWLIPAGTTKTLTIKATAPSGSSVGDILAVGIQSAADVTLSGGGTVAGTFPAYGNEFTVGSTSVGYLGVTAPTTPAANTGMISGSTEQDLASFKFTASSTEGFDINSITLTEIGTSVDSDVINMKLMYVGNQVGSTQAALSNGKVTFTGSPLFSVKAGTSKTIYVQGDVASGITSARTIRFEINDTPDVIAYGQISNGIVTIDADANNTVYAVAQGSTMTIAQGTLSVTIAPTNLTAQTYIIGEEQVELSKFKFSAGTNEGVKITKLILNEDLDAASTDYQNARLYIDDSTTPLATGGSISTTTITFEDGNGLFEIAKSGNTIVTLKVDISTGGSENGTFRVGIGAADNAYTNIVMYGLVSNEKIDSDATHITALTAVDDGDMVTHELAANGTLVISNGPNTPALSNFALGEDDFEFHQFRMQAVSEAARVTAVTVRFYDDTATAGDDSSNGATTSDVVNAELSWWDGSAWVLLDDVANPSTGVATFGFDHTIPKNTTEIFKVVADIPTGASLVSLFTGVAGTSDGYNIYDEVTASGVSSGATYGTGDTSGLSDSSVFTKVAPIVTVLASTVPTARTIIVNGNDVLLGKFFLSANNVEDIKISSLKIFTDIDGTMDGASAADLLTSTVYLRFNDGGTWRTTNTDNWSTGDSPDFIVFSGSDFPEPNEWIVPSGGTLVVEIRGDVIAAGTAYVGMTTAAANTVAAGLSSGTSATIYDSGSGGVPDAYTAIWASPELTLSAGGTITYTAATDKPTVQQVTATWDVNNPITPTFFRVKMVGTAEAIVVDAIRAKVTDQGSAAEDENFAGTVYVYEGGTMSNNVLTGGTLVGQGTLAPVSGDDSAADIVFTTPVTIPVDGIKYLTLTAELASISNGAVSGEVPYLGVDYDVQLGIWDSNYADDLNIRATGDQSNAVLYSAGAVSSILKGNAVFVVKAKLGMSVNSGSPSGADTRRASHTIFKLNMTNTSTQTDVRFRAAGANAISAITSWATTGDARLAILATNTSVDIDGTSIKFTASGNSAIDDGFYYDAGPAPGLNAYERVSFWIYVDATIAAGDLEFVIADSAGGIVSTGTPDQDEDIPAIGASTWWRADFALSGLDAGSRYYGIVSKANDSVLDSQLIYVDNFKFYYDSLSLDLASDALYDTNAATTNPAVLLKNQGGTTIATGYVSGSAASGESTAVAKVAFIPTTEISIPASGEVFSVVVDSSVLVTAADKDLSMSIDLVTTVTNAGAISSAGDVLWNDNSNSSSIGWVDSPDGPLSRGLNF